MAILDFPVLDGMAPSWADISVRLSPSVGGGGIVGAAVGAIAGAVGLLEMGDIQALSSSSTVEVGEQRNGGRVVKRTRGSTSHEASMTLYASGYQKLLKGLMAVAESRGNQKLISLVVFNINVQYTPPGLGVTDILEYRMKGCRIMGRKLDGSEGNDAQLVEVPLSVLEIVDVINGVEVAMT